MIKGIQERPFAQANVDRMIQQWETSASRNLSYVQYLHFKVVAALCKHVGRILCLNLLHSLMVIEHILNKFTDPWSLAFFSAEHGTMKLKISVSGHGGKTSSPISNIGPSVTAEGLNYGVEE